MDTLIQVLLFGGLIFVMMRFGCGSHMFGGGHGKGGHGKEKKAGGGCCGGSKNSDASSEDTQNLPAPLKDKPAPPKEDTDPVCGKTVLTKTAKTSVYDGLVYYFCSQECREIFEAEPLQYLDQDSQTLNPRLDQRPMESGGH